MIKSLLFIILFNLVKFKMCCVFFVIILGLGMLEKLYRVL